MILDSYESQLTKYEEQNDFQLPWRNLDPRLFINKRSHIVIMKTTNGQLFSGSVETNHGWYIHTDIPGHSSVDDWNPDWVWTYAPSSK